MNKTILVALAVVAIIITVSCRKNNKHTTRDLLIGTWKKNGTAVDSNLNNAIDSNELMIVYPVPDAVRLILNSDGTGQIIYGGTIKKEISWTLENNDTYLKIGYPAMTNTFTYHRLDALTSSNMTMTENSSPPMEWALYVKQ